MMEQKIPKIIHYCWFGGNPKPLLVQKCIESWKRYCSDYEIIEWNENNFDIHSNVLVEEAFEAKKWAFVSDYVRTFALLRDGGVYLDTDYELLQPLDPFLGNAFFAGFEATDTLGSAIFGCEKNNRIVRRFFEYYQGKHFRQNGMTVITTSPIVLTDVLAENGLRLNGKKQCVSDCVLYPKTVFYPTGLSWVLGKYGPGTIGVHHFMDSWGKNPGLGERSGLSKLRLCILYHARNAFGTNTMYRFGQTIRKIRQGR